MSHALAKVVENAPEPAEEALTGARALARRPSAPDEQSRSFLRMVSHELRTPLNSVIGFAEIIGRELHGPIGDPRYRDHARVIHQSGMKLLKLVNQVLEIARLESGAAEYNIQPESAAIPLKAALLGLEVEADAHEFRFRIEVDPSTPLVLADARATETILTNLLQNAIAYSPIGGEVRIKVQPFRSHVLFTIANDGDGVASEDIARLMRPFEQGESALTRRSEGAGLGLPIVRLLCSAMGGRLRLYSAPGEGLTATVRLPAVQEASPLPG